ncbi:uncharacterized protein DUF4439 [Stackebrandtia albiflava]|uniref:Uncharacterized protein DUF4439 n=1 Tax=Stackebrandtia albiflava TaxID=406432 RepID=A0A562VAK6_9ACTN|nr:ferritin-like domain-containing protein [Stackebrandtia albiflava]TWJ14881.1 uncharacterized protein DUF4439 [Stackebrandtia albiflava]
MADDLTPGLICEYEAIFGYGDAGPHLTGAERDLAVRAEQAHRDRRDAVMTWLAERGQEVPAAQPAYTLPVEPVDAASARDLIGRLEERCAAAWRSVLPDSTEEARRIAVEALAATAISAARWRRMTGVTPSTVAFPGRT